MTLVTILISDEAECDGDSFANDEYYDAEGSVKAHMETGSRS